MQLPAVRDADEVVDLALSIGEAQLAAGASAAQVTTTLQQVLSAYGLYNNVVDVTYTAITVSFQPRTRRRPETVVRVVRHRAQDYARLIGVEYLLLAIVAGARDLASATRELRDIVTAERPYRRYLSIAAWGTTSAAVAVMLGAGMAAAAGAFIAACLIYLVTSLAAARKVPPFLGQMAGAVAAVAVAVGLDRTGVHARPSLVVVSGIITLLAGMTFVGAVTDALTEYYLTASARLLEVALLTGGVIAGVSLGLEVATRVGVTFNAAPAPRTLTDLPLVLAGSAVSAAGYAYAAYAPKRCLVPVATYAALGQLAAVATTQTGLGGPWAAGAAALTVAVAAYTAAPWTGTPGLVGVGAGIIPLLPGLAIYRGLYALTGISSTNGILTLAGAAALGAAIAVGALVGERLSHPILRALGRPTPAWPKAR